MNSELLQSASRSIGVFRYQLNSLPGLLAIAELKYLIPINKYYAIAIIARSNLLQSKIRCKFLARHGLRNRNPFTA